MKNRVYDAVKDARATLASIPIYAQALCGDRDVRVVFDPYAETARTDGRVLTLPGLPMPRSAEDVETCQVLADLIEVFIPHEVGHIRFTRFREMAGMKTDLERSLLNCIEDPRMECETIAFFPGTRAQMDRGCERLGQLGWFPPLSATDSPASVLTGIVLYHLRGQLREQELMADLAEQGWPVVAEVFGEAFANRLKVLLDTDGMRMRSTKDASALTRAVLVAMKEAEAQKPAGGNGDKPNPSTGGHAGQSGEPEQPSSGSDGGEADGGQSQAGSGSGNSPFARAEAEGDQGFKDLGAILSEAMKSTVGDIHAKGMQQIGQRVRSAAHEGASSDATDGRLVPEDGVQQVIGALKARLRAKLQTKTQSRTHESVRGSRVSERLVHRASQCSRRMFVHVDERKDVETVVYLLGDRSASMQGAQVRILGQALFGVAEAMHSLRGVKVGAGVFPSNRILIPIGAAPASRLDHLAVQATGGTPMGEAMYWAARQLSRRREPRKILMVMTDGTPSDPWEVEMAKAALERMGVEVFGVGIGADEVSKLFPKHCVIRSINELPSVMLDMLHKALVTGPQQRLAA